MTRVSALGGKMGLWQKSLMRMLYYYLESGWQPKAGQEWLVSDYGFYWPWDDAAQVYMLLTACMGGKPEISMLINTQAKWKDLHEYLEAWRKDVLRAMRTLAGDKELIVRNRVSGGPIGSRMKGSPNERLSLTEDGVLRAQYEYEKVLCKKAPGGQCGRCNTCRRSKHFATLIELVPARYMRTQPLKERQQEREEHQAEQDYWEERWEEQEQEREDKLARVGAVYEVNADGERQLVGFEQPMVSGQQNTVSDTGRRGE